MSPQPNLLRLWHKAIKLVAQPTSCEVASGSSRLWFQLRAYAPCYWRLAGTTCDALAPDNLTATLPGVPAPCEHRAPLSDHNHDASPCPHGRVLQNPLSVESLQESLVARLVTLTTVREARVNPLRRSQLVIDLSCPGKALIDAYCKANT